MKRKIGLIVIGLMLLSGTAYAAGQWGTYQGNTVIRLTVNGVPTKVTDVPAMLYNDRTMIPIYLLKEAGIQYTWDQDNQTVDIIKEAEPRIPESGDLSEMAGSKPTPREIFKMAKAVGYVEAYGLDGQLTCSGSGVMVGPNYFVTNEHVANCGKSGKISVSIDGGRFNNGDSGWYIYSNPETDLHIVNLSTAFDENGYPIGDTPSTVFNLVKTELPQIGDKVYAIGSPYGFENTISEGIVSGIRNINGMTLIQHTCDTESGSSGGALMDEDGYLIGITSAGYAGTSLDFAIPIQYVQNEING